MKSYLAERLHMLEGMSQIKLGSVISYITIFINIVLGLVYTPWILKTVGSSNYALYTLSSSFIALFLLDFGMSAAVTRFISNFRAQNKFDSINSFVGFSIKFYVVLCAIIAIILTVMYFFLPQIYTQLTAVEISSLKLVFIITAFFIVICFPVVVFNGILNAFEQYIPLKGADLINKLGTVITTVIVLMIVPNIYLLVLINGLFSLITLLLKIFFVKKRTPVRISFNRNQEVSFKNIISFSLWSTANTISQQLTNNAMPTVLGMVANSFSIAVYGFANVMEGFVYNISQGINGFFMPSVSRIIIDEDDASKVLPLMKKVGRINLSIMALLFIGLFTLGKEFVHLWIGDEYSVLYICFLLITMHYPLLAPEQIAVTSVSVQNKIKYTATINLVCSIMGIVLAYFITPVFGIVGACGAVLISNLCKFCGYNIVYFKIMHINIFSFFKDCFLKMLPALCLVGIISYLIANYIPLFADGFLGWIYFFIKVMSVVIVYFVVMWLMGWNKEEKNMILSFLPHV